MKAYRWIGILCSGMLLVSCAHAEEETLRYEAETTVEYGVSMYVEDIREHGKDVADDFFLWRNEGNPAPVGYENAVPFENGTDIRWELTAPRYSLSEGDETWGITLAEVSDDVNIRHWCKNLNLEKLEDGVWVRQGILSEVWLNDATHDAILVKKTGQTSLPSGPAFPSDAELWKEGLTLLSPLTVEVSAVFPQASPGQYRFVFYVSVKTDGGMEYRQYYIPFTVTE